MTEAPAKKELRLFGLGLAFAATVLTIGAWLRHGAENWAWPWLPAVAAVLAILAAVFPLAIRPIHFVLNPIFHAIGVVLTNLLMSIFFFLVLTPVAVVIKLLGRDALARKFPGKQASYWQDKKQPEDSVERYERLF